MNAYETTGVRELTAQELDQVTGGAVTDGMDGAELFAFAAVTTWLVGTAALAVASFFDWLFS